MATAYRILIILCFFSLILMGLGQALAGRFGLLWGFFISISFIFYLYFYGNKNLLKKLKASPPLEGQSPWGIGPILDKISQRSEVHKPSLHIIEADTTATFAFGLGRFAHIVLTQGVVEKFETPQIEALIAFHLAQIKRHDTIAVTLACNINMILMGSLSFLSKWNSSLFLSPNSYLKSDALAKKWLDNPDALAKALFDMETYLSTNPLTLNPALAMGFPINPLTKTPINEYLHIHPDLEKRIQAIKDVGH